MKWIEIWAMLQVGGMVLAFGILGMVLLWQIVVAVIGIIKRYRMELRGICCKCEGKGKIENHTTIGEFTWQCLRCNGTGHSKYFEEE